MKKYKRKLIPTNPMNIPALESWLQDMAENGYFLVSMGVYFAKFKTGEPQKLAYRIEPVPVEDHGFYVNNIRNAFSSSKDEKQSLSIEEKNKRMVELYDEFGWELVCKMNALFYIFRGKEENAPELHTDPVAQSLAYARIYKRQKKGMLFTLPFFIALFLWCLYITIWGDNLYYSVKSGSSLWVCGIGLVISVLELAKDIQAHRHIRDHLQNGVPMEHHADWQKGAFFYKLKYGLYHVFLLCFVFSGYFQINQRQRSSFDEIQHPLPYLSLETIETAENFMPDTTKDWYNCVEYSASFLAPIQYDIQQKGIVPDQRWEDDSGVYSPSMHIEYIDLRFQLLAAPFFDSMTQRKIYDDEKKEVLFLDGIDEALLFSGESNQRLFLRNQDIVMAISYYGKEDLKAHLSEIVALTEGTYSKKLLKEGYHEV